MTFQNASEKVGRVAVFFEPRIRDGTVAVRMKYLVAMQNAITPKLFTTLGKSYTKAQFVKDLIAGILVGIIAIPLSIALAISSGVSPQVGLFTAIVAGFLISFFGGSRVQIGGPTAAFVPIVYAIVQQHGLEGLTIATIMAGCILVLMGLLRLGKLIKFIPYPVVTGFTAGIAIAIAFKQVKDLLGLPIENLPGDFLPLCKTYAAHLDGVSPSVLAISVVSLILIFAWAKIPFKAAKFVPGSLVAIIVTTVGAMLLGMDHVPTIGSRFPNISASLPPVTIPTNASLDVWLSLIAPAFTIAVLAGIESLLSAVVADGMIGGHHRSNAELVGQGVANVGSALLGGIPATGAIARTAANIRAGGRTPIAGITHAMTVLIIMLVLMPYAKLIPLATLAAILIVIAYNMGDWLAFRNIHRAPKSDAAVFLITFALTVVFDLVIAIEVGLVLAAFLFIKRMADVTEVALLSDEDEGDSLSDLAERDRLNNSIGEQILLYEIKGPFFFGAADKFLDVAGKMNINTRAIVIKMQSVPAMDQTASHFLTSFYKACAKRGTKIYLTHLQPQPKRVLAKHGLLAELTSKHIHVDTRSAIAAAQLDIAIDQESTEVERVLQPH